MANYEETVAKFEWHLQETWNCVETIILSNIDNADNNKRKALRTEVFEKFAKYDAKAGEFMNYLEGVRSPESADRLLQVSEHVSRKRQSTTPFIEKLKSINDERSSVTSEHSRQSSASGTSSRSKLEAERVKVAYAEQAAALERKRAEIEEQEKISAAAATRKKADIEIDIKLLEERKEIAVVEAELDRSVCSNDELDRIPHGDSLARTSEYVRQTANIEEHLDPKVVSGKAAGPTEHLIQTTSDFTKFLLRKDILMSRLSVFNEQPESFQSWKATFKAVVKEIAASPSEEIDLLIKWLGPNSRKTAMSLKTAYILDPDVGLARIWSRLDERFGAPESIYSATINKLEAFPKLTTKDSVRLYDLSDILSEIEGLKKDPRYSTTLSYFDSAAGIIPIVNKLPHNLQERWTTRATDYKKRHQTSFSPFEVFAEFILEHSRIRNDPSFHYETTSPVPKSYVDQRQQFTREKRTIAVRKTEVEACCPIHNNAKHMLSECYVFKKKSSVEKGQFLRENKICYKCVNSSEHQAKDCNASVKCEVCSSTNHISVMHIYKPQDHGRESDKVKTQVHGGEYRSQQNITSKRTEIDQDFKSCAKIVLVDMFLDENPDNVCRCYAIVDEQRNKTLGRPELFDMLGVKGVEEEFCLNSCAGTTVRRGRRVGNCNVRSLDGSVCYQLPSVIECADIPCNKREICTPDDVRDFSHLCNIVDKLPQADENIEILLLLGRDVIDAHHVLDQVIGPPGAPFAQRLSLGWVVVGELCIGNFHPSNMVNVNKTQLLSNGRPSLFKPCESVHAVVENCYSYDPVFTRKVDDNQRSSSVDDREFLGIMDEHMHRDDSGFWIAPLPFRQPRARLPNNRDMALRRAESLHSSLCRNPVKKNQLVEFMSKIIDKGHAEIAPHCLKMKSVGTYLCLV